MGSAASPLKVAPPGSAESAALLTAAVLVRHDHDPHALVQVLREVQASLSWLPRKTLDQLARALGLTLAHVEGVATFYRFFHIQPVGAYRVLFIDNVTDRMQGSVALLADLCQRLGVEKGQLRADVLLAAPSTPGAAIAAALAMGVPALLNEMTVSKLRGRGGAGYPTAKKWALCRAASAIGHVTQDPHRFVRMQTRVGGQRIVDWLSGEPLPRIC